MLSKYTYVALAALCLLASCQRKDEMYTASEQTSKSAPPDTSDKRAYAVVLAAGCSGESCNTGLRIISGKEAGSSCIYKEGLLGVRGDTLLVKYFRPIVAVDLYCSP